MTTASCPECGSAHKEGALFCDECGSALYEGVYDTLVQPAAERSDVSPNTPEQPEAILEPGEILISVLSSGRRVSHKLNNEIQLGREDPARDIHPNLDLTPDDGLALGVSRMHAALQGTENGVMVVDLGSTNGTNLREKSLIPYRPVHLRTGDIIQLGQLQIQVFFKGLEDEERGR